MGQLQLNKLFAGPLGLSLSFSFVVYIFRLLAFSLDSFSIVHDSFEALMKMKGRLVLILVFGDCQVPILQIPVYFIIDRKDSFENNISVQV